MDFANHCGIRRSLPAVAFDLDETLVLGTSLQPPSDHFSVRVGRQKVFVSPRPGLVEFMKKVSSVFDVYFFTFSLPAYAKPVIDAIAPETPADHCLFRNQCTEYSGYPVKDLRLLHRPLERVIIVDDMEGSALLQPSNLIRVTPWHGQNLDDRVLTEQLWPLLQSIADESDLPLALHRNLNQQKYKDLFTSMVGEFLHTTGTMERVSDA
jgi:RNA polymerase II subunit A small phosphatase-like protein